MVNQLLVTLVDSVLGKGKNTSKNNRAYHCPFCNHHKPITSWLTSLIKRKEKIQDIKSLKSHDIFSTSLINKRSKPI